MAKQLTIKMYAQEVSELNERRALLVYDIRRELGGPETGTGTREAVQEAERDERVRKLDGELALLNERYRDVLAEERRLAVARDLQELEDLAKRHDDPDDEFRMLPHQAGALAMRRMQHDSERN